MPQLPLGRRTYWKRPSSPRDLPDAAIDTFVEFCANFRTSPLTLAILEHAHGAMTRHSVESTAFPTRTAPIDCALISIWTDPAEDAHHIDWTRRFHTAMRPFSDGTVYVNTLDQDDGSRVPEAYGPNYARLCAVKAKYDPDNRFRRNQNIQPRA